MNPLQKKYNKIELKKLPLKLSTGQVGSFATELSEPDFREQMEIIKKENT